MVSKSPQVLLLTCAQDESIHDFLIPDAVWCLQTLLSLLMVPLA